VQFALSLFEKLLEIKEQAALQGQRVDTIQPLRDELHKAKRPPT
jgi:hypothetical protein